MASPAACLWATAHRTQPQVRMDYKRRFHWPQSWGDKTYTVGRLYTSRSPAGALFTAVPPVHRPTGAFFNVIYKGPWTADRVFLHVFGFPASKIAKCWRACQIRLGPGFWEVTWGSVPAANLSGRMKPEMLSAPRATGDRVQPSGTVMPADWERQETSGPV